MRKSAWILSLFLLGASCLEQPDCYNLTNNILNISYRKISDGALDTVAMESITVVGLDSAFEGTNTGITGIPLDFTGTALSIILDQNDKTRQLDFGYRVQQQFVTEECGPRFLFSDLVATSSTGDSVRVLSTTPGGTVSHVAVYRCPRNNVVRLAFRQLDEENDEIRDTLSITAAAADFDAFSYYPITGDLSFINLPLNLATNSTQITLELTNPERIAILNFTYEVVTRTVYEICGAQPFIRNVQVSSDLFDTQSITSTSYTTDSIYDPPKINFALFQ